jgi:hypothetical protein
MLVGPIVDRLTIAIPQIVHLKLFAQCESGYLKAAVTASGGDPQVEGALDASPAREYEIVINVRALCAPAELRAIVEREVGAVAARVEWHEVRCFRPAAPVPYLRL